MSASRTRARLVAKASGTSFYPSQRARAWAAEKSRIRSTSITRTYSYGLWTIVDTTQGQFCSLTRSRSSSLQSFPSGHTAAAFAVGVFMALYINAKLKVFFTDYSPTFWKAIFVLCPIIGASLIGGGLHVDHVRSLSFLFSQKRNLLLFPLLL